MAVASFDQDTLEDIIATAVRSGLATNDRRSQLLAHLPQRFVDKVQLFDEPVEQLRADVVHLNAHPRLPDHHQAPLASWLQNAYLLTTPSDEARVFRQFRNQFRLNHVNAAPFPRFAPRSYALKFSRFPGNVQCAAT